jgi:hypothetical protein
MEIDERSIPDSVVACAAQCLRARERGGPRWEGWPVRPEFRDRFSDGWGTRPAGRLRGNAGGAGRHSWLGRAGTGRVPWPGVPSGIHARLVRGVLAVLDSPVCLYFRDPGAEPAVIWRDDDACWRVLAPGWAAFIGMFDLAGPDRERVAQDPGQPPARRWWCGRA